MQNTKPLISVLLRHDIDASKTRIIYLDYDFLCYTSKKAASDAIREYWTKVAHNRKMVIEIFDKVVKLGLEGKSYSAISSTLTDIAYSPKVVGSAFQDYCKVINNELFLKLINEDDNLTKLIRENLAQFKNYVPNPDTLLRALEEIREAYAVDYMSIDNYEELSKFCSIERPKVIKKEVNQEKPGPQKSELNLYVVKGESRDERYQYSAVIASPSESVAHSFAVTDPIHTYTLDEHCIEVKKIGTTAGSDFAASEIYPNIIVSNYGLWTD